MITEAISTLKERTGSSQPAIAKFLEEKYEKVLPSNFRKMLSVQLKNCVKTEKLVKVKNSYKISASQKTNSAKEIKGKKDVKKMALGATNSPKLAAKKAVEKAMKTKRLSQVKTPEALKKKSAKKGDKKMKGLSPVKTPEGIKKKKKKNVTPMKNKVAKKPEKSTKPAAKKAKK